MTNEGISGPGFLLREMRKRGIRVYSDSFPKFEWRFQGNHITEDKPLWTDEWEEQAGTLVDAIKEFEWFFEAGVIGKVTGHDWLECGVCGEIQMTDKKNGAPSASKKCAMTVRCKGKLRRFDEDIFDVANGKKRAGHHGGRKSVDIAIIKEGLAVFDRTQSLTDAARWVREHHEGMKTAPSVISRWLVRREKNPELFAD